MSNVPKNQHTPVEKHEDAEELEFEDMELPERLETLREDMEDLKVNDPTRRTRGLAKRKSVVVQPRSLIETASR